MFEEAIRVLSEQRDRLESNQKCFKNKFIFQKDILELQSAIKLLESEGKNE